MATIGPGDLVADRYRLVRPDGGSAAMRVWEARDEVLGRIVTVREITGRKRLGMAEAQALARYDRVLDVVEAPGRVWVVTTVSAGPPNAVGLARVGDLTTELDRPGAPGEPLAATPQSPAGPGAPAAGPGTPAATPVSPGARSTAPAANAARSTAPAANAARSTAPAANAAGSGAAAPEARATGPGAPASDPWAGGSEPAASAAGAGVPPAEVGPPRAEVGKPPAGPGAPASGAAAPSVYPGQRATPAGPSGGRPGAPGSGFGALAARIGAPPARPPADGRPAWRRPRTLILAAATLIVIGAGTGIALAANSKDSDSSTGAKRSPAAATKATAGPTASATTAASPATSAAPVATFVPCGAGAAQGVMKGTPTTRQVSSGYIWHRDFQGFSFEVPDGWERSRVKNTFCFRDPAGGRGFVVTSGVSGADAAAYFTGQERGARKSLPGYRRVSLTEDGWEYTWKPSDGVVRHSRQVLVTPQAGTTYGVQWITSDAQWANDGLVFEHVLDTFEIAPQS